MQQWVEGFIVHSYARTVRGRTRLYLIGRLRGGDTFAAVEQRYRPHLYLRRSDAGRAGALLEAAGVPPARRGSDGAGQPCTMDGEPCLRLEWESAESRRQARAILAAAGVRSYEADLRPTDHFRLERGIHAAVRLRGESRPGRRVGRVYVDPEVEPGEWLPQLSLLSVDIETDPQSSRLLALGMFLVDPFRELRAGRVFFAGAELGHSEITCLPGEAALLDAFREQLRLWDPDILTGWNVIDFDFRVLWERFRHHRIEMDLGRSSDRSVVLPGSSGRSVGLIVPGRETWDGARLVRASPLRFEDYTLETVAEAVLGRGKRLQVSPGESRLSAIDRLHRENPVEFCLYCLEDARLVAEILERTGLLELTVRRCQLIGVAPDRAWTSIPAFEHLYIEAMHRRGRVAPTAGVDSLPLEAAPGGAILPPRPGLHEGVMVFDFRSLYPSIIRTFNIDPLSYRPALEEDGPAGEASPSGEAADGGGPIRAPNGAAFSREPAVLPELLDRFFQERREARARGDAIASFVYKIIMNSFYGVLGSPGCRFAGSALSGAITSFGQHLLAWSRDFLQRRGLQVLYGDTDSLFVAAPPEASRAGAAGSLGRELAGALNAALRRHLRVRYGVRSRLSLELEKLYERFFLPPLRGAGGGQLGRAKGYAGLLARREEEAGDGRPQPAGAGVSRQAGPELRARIEIRGMEAVRRDWTDLAHDFQISLLELVFAGSSGEEVRKLVREVLRRLEGGELDGALVYRKALRKPIEAYLRSRPPHVQAAALLDPEDRRGLIRYVVTREGPQPVSRVSASIDYGHYVERQLKPIVSTFAEVLRVEADRLFGEGQLWLFEGDAGS